MKARVIALASAAAVAMSALAAVAAHAALDTGATAPEFKATAYLAGEKYDFDLDKALKKGPVVVYFFPAAFTAGCQIEAHLFAESADKFKAEGATILGVTAGNVDRVGEFSKDTRYCSGKFPIAADTDGSIAKLYASSLVFKPGWSGRDSYVINKNHKIVLSYSDLKPDDHVNKTLAAVTKIKSGG
jgi:peroxiredoxin Q/BCP